MSGGPPDWRPDADVNGFRMEQKRTAVFLGAGFSYWAANLPLASSLFDFDIDTARLSNADAGKLLKAEEDWKLWCVGNPDSSAEQFIAWAQSRRCGKRINWYVSRRLSEPFITRIYGNYATLMIDDRRAREHGGVVKAKTLLQAFPQHALSGVVTSNYDMLVEFALGTSGFNYGMDREALQGRGHNPQFPWQHTPVFASGPVPLAKLHGSLSWDRNSKYTDGKPGRSGNALLVPPVPEKTAPPDLRQTWALARKILKQADQMVVFGFAFNPYDQALLELIRQASGHVQRVLLMDPYPRIDMAKDTWPRAQVSTASTVPLFLKDLKRWLGPGVTTSRRA